MDETPRRSPFVSNWILDNRQAVRKCYENGCIGHVYWCGSEFVGDADWAIYRCTICGAGWKEAGVWSYPIPPVTKSS